MKNIGSIFAKIVLTTLFLTSSLVAGAEAIKVMKAKENDRKLWGYVNDGEQEYWWKQAHCQGDDEKMLSSYYATEWLIPPVYAKVSKEFSEGLAQVEYMDEVGFIDRYNRFMIPPQFEPVDKMEGFRFGLAVVKKDGKYGYINKKGEFVIPPVFDGAENFNDDKLAVVKMGKRFGAIDFHGDTVVPCHHITEETMRYLPFKNKEYKKVAKAVKARYDEGYYDDAINAIRATEKEVNEQIKNISYIPPMRYQPVIQKSGDYYGMKAQGRGDWWYIMPNKTKITPLGKRLYLSWKKENCDVLDRYGRIITLYNKFVAANYHPTERLLTVTTPKVVIGGREFSSVGMYDEWGRMIIPPCLDNISSFSNGKARISLVGVTGEIDVHGQVSDEFLQKVLDAIDGKEYERYVLGLLIKLRPTCITAQNNLALFEINDDDDLKSGIHRLAVANRLAPDNEQVKANLKAAKSERNDRRFDRILNVLTVTGEVINTAATTYAAIEGSGSSSSSSYSSSSYESSSDVGSSGSRSRSSSSNKKKESGADAANKNRDANTYSNYESQLIKMNTYYENEYNDSDRRSIQSKMRQIRTKWESRGYQMFKSEWETWNGSKR